jgi:alpha-L-arabinofuranosidase
MKVPFVASLLALLTTTADIAAQPAVTLTVQADQPGASISPTMWGIFFEDINYGADGGLYPERVKNRSFEFPNALMGWTEMAEGDASGLISVTNREPLGLANPHYLRLHADSGGFGVANEGFFGMGVTAGESYAFSLHGRGPRSSVVCGCGRKHWELLPPPLRVELIGPEGVVLAQARLKRFGPEWAIRTATLRPKTTEAKARLRLVLEQGGELHLDLISLLPKKTFKNHGLRADVVQLLADLKPGFMRFPGGCIVEGKVLETRYQWKTTIGPVAERKLIVNRWNDEFKHRPAPDYYQSFGLGFFEFFQLCEDIGAAPLPILNCGMACQFNSNELVPLDRLDPYIQDALDLIEFANGPAASPWGAKRAAMGHPKPFGMKFLGVGNEQWGPQYVERYETFARALKAKHPEIQLISSAGPDPDGDKFEFLWPKLRALKADVVDEHYYRPPGWFLDNTQRYDRYDRNGPKVFAGEYAAQSVKTVSPDNRNNWDCALAEAAMLTGFERNADVVRLASYAPLSAHVEGWQWTPNLIWFDNLRAYGTPSYYVQQLFSRNRGDRVLPVQLSGALPKEKDQPRFYATATRDEKTGEVILKVVNAAARPVETTLQLKGVGRIAPEASATVLTGATLADENSLAEPRKVAPVTSIVGGVGSDFRQTFKPYSLTVLRIKARL